MNKVSLKSIVEKSDNNIVLNVDSAQSFIKIEEAYKEVEINVLTNSTIYLSYDIKDIEVVYNININEMTQVDLIILNEFNSGLNDYNINVGANAVINLYCVDLSKSNVTNMNINLNGDYASCNVNTTTISRKESTNKQVIVTNHNNKVTSSNCISRAVVFDKSSYDNKTEGFIAKGMSQSKCHQDTKAIIFDASASAKCDPVLLIDEYDVEASHAAAVGQIDPEELYYLQSRGLTYSECITLLVNGFVVSVIDNVLDSVKEELIERISESLNV